MAKHDPRELVREAERIGKLPPPPPPPSRSHWRSYSPLPSSAPGRRWNPSGVVMVIGAIPAAVGATVAVLLPLVDRFMPDMSLYVTREELSRELKSRDAEWARASLECSTALAKSGAAESLSREAKSQCDALNVLYQSMQGRGRRR